jgi:uncharacterized protein DUF6600
MKSFSLVTAFCLAGSLILGLLPASAELEVSAGVSIHAATDFYEPLAPNGAWVDVGAYGHCWHPAGVEAGWRPYCNGSWEWTDAGWYWVSDEPWAWACYHYGTWIDDPSIGWCWVPGVEWAPAWVYWRMGGDHIGWAPCAPAGLVVEPSFFVFVESRHFHDHIRPDTVIVNNATIINNTTEIKNVRRENRQLDGKSQTVVVNEGPGVDVVEKATGQKFTAVSVREADRKTFVSVPEKLKHPTGEPAPNEKPLIIHGQPNSRPDKIIPQSPPDRIVPPDDKGLPLDKEQQHPKDIVPPSQPPQPSSKPIPPLGNSGSNEKGQDKDKDQGHDNL